MYAEKEGEIIETVKKLLPKNHFYPKTRFSRWPHCQHFLPIFFSHFVAYIELRKMSLTGHRYVTPFPRFRGKRAILGKFTPHDRDEHQSRRPPVFFGSLCSSEGSSQHIWKNLKFYSRCKDPRAAKLPQFRKWKNMPIFGKFHSGQFSRYLAETGQPNCFHEDVHAGEFRCRYSSPKSSNLG